jgi:hypothetical protein
LQRSGQSRGDDVSDALALQRRHDRFIEEAAVRAQQVDDLVSQMMQGGFEELQDVVGAMKQENGSPLFLSKPNFQWIIVTLILMALCWFPRHCVAIF